MTQAAPETPADPRALMRSIIQRIATGPELSKDISRAEARAGMLSILDGHIDPVQSAIFLIALRMKRETDEEYLGVLEALRDATHIVSADVEELVDVADPCDGFNRSLPASPFLPAVLAACGVPALSHGVESMGPKFGVTTRQVLEAAGLPVDLTPGEAAARIADPALGWAYLDQRVFCPKLHALTALRTLIVKRPALTTIETLLGPVRARGRTHLLTGFVHKAYPRIYALLARASGFDSALIVRGVEGGVTPSLRQSGRLFHYTGTEEEKEVTLLPADFGIADGVRPATQSNTQRENSGAEGAETPFDAASAARDAAAAGLAALRGTAGPIRDALISAGAICLWHLGRSDSLRIAADVIREALDSQRALTHLSGGSTS